jgi:hypothetical protein
MQFTKHYEVSCPGYVTAVSKTINAYKFLEGSSWKEIGG